MTTTPPLFLTTAWYNQLKFDETSRVWPLNEGNQISLKTDAKLKLSATIVTLLFDKKQIFNLKLFLPSCMVSIQLIISTVICFKNSAELQQISALKQSFQLVEQFQCLICNETVLCLLYKKRFHVSITYINDILDMKIRNLKVQPY